MSKKANFLEILGTKVAQFSCYTKLIRTKNVLLNWYYPTKSFFRKIRMIFDIENWPWKSDFGTFWHLFFGHLTRFNKSHEKINAIFLISATMASIWNVFIKFHWHDEKLTGTIVISWSEVAWWRLNGGCLAVNFTIT